MQTGDPNIPITKHGGCLAAAPRSNSQLVSQLTTYWLEFKSFKHRSIIFSIEFVVLLHNSLNTNFLANLLERTESKQYIHVSLSDYSSVIYQSK